MYASFGVYVQRVCMSKNDAGGTNGCKRFFIIDNACSNCRRRIVARACDNLCALAKPGQLRRLLTDGPR